MILMKKYEAPSMSFVLIFLKKQIRATPRADHTSPTRKMWFSESSAADVVLPLLHGASL